MREEAISKMNALLQRIKEQIAELNNQKKVIEKYWDISENIDRWSTKRFSTAMINSEVNDVMIKHNCGCCEDSPLEAWPFKEIEGIKVYSKPAYFYIGEKNAYGIGDNPDEDWQALMRKSNIAEPVIKIIQKYFDDNPPTKCEYDYDDLDDETYFEGRE